jgi:uncharacterized protein
MGREHKPAVTDEATVARRVLLAFTGLNGLAALGHAPGFAMATGGISGGLEARLYLALTTQLLALALAAGLVLVPFTLSRWSRRALWIVAPSLFGCLQAFLFVDRKVYNLFKFHLNGVAMDVVLARGGVQAMGFQGQLLWDAALRAASLFTLEAAAFLWLSRAADRTRVPGWKVVVAGVLALVLTDTGVHAIIDASDRTDFARVESVVPLYGPRLATAALLALGVESASFEGPSRPARTIRLPRYPAAPLQFHEPSGRPHLLWVVIDSWRSDAYAADLTPKMWEFGQQALVFRHHVSGANETRRGNFSMFYGLPGPYLDPFQGAQQGPVLLTRLRGLGYGMHVISSLPLAYTVFEKSVFAEVTQTIEDRYRTDREAALRATELLEGDADRPQAVVLFLNDVHLPYVFPAEFARHTPFAAASESMEADPARVQRLHNRYLNAVGWEDAIVGDLLARLGHRLDNAIVLITADHGEEFYEHGAWSHTSSFHAEQIMVPLILHLPGVAPGVRQDLTSHVDIVPTLLPLLGVENPPSDYSVGRSLLDGPGRVSALTCDWNACAVTDANGNAAEFRQGDRRDFEVFDPGRNLVTTRSMRMQMGAEVVAANGELQRFLR